MSDKTSVVKKRNAIKKLNQRIADNAKRLYTAEGYVKLLKKEMKGLMFEYGVVTKE